MTLFTLLSALSVAFVSTQLALQQHTALMELYTALGPQNKQTNKAVVDFFSFPGCDTSTCTRFPQNQPCSGVGLECSGSNVVALYDALTVVCGLSDQRSVGSWNCRYLHDNQLTGTIPSTVGQLTALTRL
jgi:hypothetical protein